MRVRKSHLAAVPVDNPTVIMTLIMTGNPTVILNEVKDLKDSSLCSD